MGASLYGESQRMAKRWRQMQAGGGRAGAGVCVYVCVCVCVHLRARVCVRVCVHVCVYMCAIMLIVVPGRQNECAPFKKMVVTSFHR
jgi:hypothetical protein